MDDADLTEDGFLGGRLRILQPRTGYRAATDPVFLAAAVPAKSGQSVLELGVGTGVAALCLGHRVEGLELVGVELQPEHAALARQNALVNRISLSVVQGDVLIMPSPVKDRSFDHVIANPPYFEEGEGTLPTTRAKAIAHAAPAGALTGWIDAGLRRLGHRGRLTMILRTAALPEAMAALATRADITVLPLAARAGRAAGRVILSARKGGRSACRLLPPFLVHDGQSHDRDGDDYSDVARKILRDGIPLKIDPLGG